ncbi:hypothetical protein QVD17_27114 [Tagetes erecta]|uniref:Uncharacterized protein n=1 Tax=Tagetes erecta TaxID=13708 RepID=A0AAD8NRC7_TARER|nr:hypothetical protein QVD17_27114 [Tagetes erecta]
MMGIGRQPRLNCNSQIVRIKRKKNTYFSSSSSCSWALVSKKSYCHLHNLTQTPSSLTYNSITTSFHLDSHLNT